MTTISLSAVAALTLAMGRGYHPVPQAPPVTAAQACPGAAADADLALRSQALERVAPLYRNVRSGRHLAGAVLTYRSASGLTGERLEAALRCQAARGRELRPQGSPLAIEGVEVRVRADDGVLRAEITAEDVAGAREVLARSEGLLAGSTP